MDLTGPVLGIESSCDETAAAVLAPDGAILAESVFSQTEDHARFGGVVPELAARAHLSHLPGLVAGVMEKAGVTPRDLGGVAATSGPGLIGGLIVGASFGKGMALANNLPFVAVNHLEAHALTPRLPGLLPGGAAFPYLLLLLSGGHCQCVAVEGLGRYRRLGTTLDDAVGEAFDKAAKLLGLPWPGGPYLERMAKEGDASRAPLPRPMFGRPGCDFSFSGLKTAVAQAVSKGQAAHADIAAAFQTSVAAVVADRARNALEMAPGATALVVSGGVAANSAVRASLSTVADKAGLPLVAPPIRLCTDNAVMVAWAGIERLRAGLTDPWDHAPRPRWPLDELSPAA
ncbi:tRNA (adenosine(37)-N6)-threonylcarbamoyltransferase complex transferase subunit TsaD [Roseomonas xinghualingensis]|uniref:tRNA (adenosine(37)-N6)-threonylcarbamoyltransferase complex transferase subunit TsaD n=1 Tax=Roseomonas xinghualingensis TaxID=2986475 RepID=UPI0021F19A18|nr:tRNA (adenosine(37)-N6)-threonylcarbamoyltransferase complex transferase subunit TsaD [Roseomonas sp. SXEYE001]MCV4207611.1 tRNA (adenosine(37)-N6)-threonylcarbamoyltransferase complex transferase subunit TsaD [Roseomonas sp. SXEYE001]